MLARKPPSLEYLRECFDLDSKCPSGLRWKARPRYHFNSNNGWKIFLSRFKGKGAGSLITDNKGQKYYRVTINYVLYPTHRMVYSLFHSKEIPLCIQIDHIDGNGCNNDVLNLRLATHGDNSQNRCKPKNNTSGYKGVLYRKTNATWFGKVIHTGVIYYTGHSPSKDIVVDLVRELRESLHKKFTHH